LILAKSVSKPNMTGVGAQEEIHVGRPWRLAFQWLAALGIFFFLSYGFANWAASKHSELPSVVFGWDRFIPFLPWAIVPYMSAGFFYVGSLFLCRSRSDLNLHAKRLLLAQLGAVTLFLLFPLQYGAVQGGFSQSGAAGGFAWMFDVLKMVDQPFNQAPSLHAAFTVILAAKYCEQVNGVPRALLLGWFLLLAISTLTTRQHHVFDVATGLLLGYLCLRCNFVFNRPPAVSALEGTQGAQG
jgi:membrane-associated phospholipid phosphatase